MSNAPGILIAEAVRAALAAASLSIAFTPSRGYLPTFTLEDLATLRVVVVPSEWSEDFADRSLDRVLDLAVDVVVLKKVNVDDNTEVDPLMGLLWEIGGYFRSTAISISGYNAPIYLGAAMYPGAPAGYSPEHAEENRAFVGMVKLRFRVIE